MTRVLVITAALAALAVAGCGGSGGGDSVAGGEPTAQKSDQPSARKANTPPRSSPDPDASSQGSLVSLRETSYGTILADGDGRTLYLFTKESSDTSRCYGACAQAWPPFLTKDEPRAGRGAKPDLLGTTRRSDGATQVTYRGHPLYYYVDDTQPGEVGCQNVSEFGGLWLIVTPDGEAIKA